MFTPHQSMHQFSPQRRQILGTGKRTGQKKAFLGDEEAGNVGPQKLFADLKNTAGKQASGSNVFSKSPSRALGVKNTQSPQRSHDYPLKPPATRLESTAPPLNVSPVKAKSRARSQSPSKATRQVSPIRDVHLPLSTTPLHNDLDEGTSYLTTATPFPRLPQTPPADLHEQRPSFVTPASNIGEAGAMRLRKGEMFDALNQVQEEAQVYESEPLAESRATLEEEEYPEIEYMPPSIDIPYDFPPQLDGLPRAKELGESMAKMSMTGFYRPTSEEKKQEMLAEVFKFRPGKVEEPLMPRRQSIDEIEQWPDVEISVPMKGQVASSRTAFAPATQRTTATGVKKAHAVKGSTIERPTIGIKATKASTSLKSASIKPRALGERDSNATVKKKVMNPALRDFENDQMGKIIKAKLQASQVQETEGFLL